MDSVAKNSGQSPAAAQGNACACPKCGTDVLATGFVVQEVKYQAYLRKDGKLWRSHRAKSAFESATCMLCSERLMVAPEDLKKAA